ncbi:hypothetical protein AgCh_020199 [Apium graveolens]
MCKCSRKDNISDLPQSIIDSILTKLPRRDAVKTSFLSTKWRYQWTTMTQLIFDESCVIIPEDENTESDTVNFIMRFLLRHDGPIHKFLLSTSCLTTATDIEQWLLFVSKKEIKVLDLYVWRYDWWCKDQRFRIPTCVFPCQKLTKLKLSGYEVRPPIGFRGFPCLKHLDIYGGASSAEAVENLISGCPLLEKFKFSNLFEPLALTIRAPHLKHLSLSDAFKDIYLEHTPHLVSISINLITTVRLGSDEDADLDFWEKECPADFTFKQLKVVGMSFVSSEIVMQFLKFVLGHSPVLEVMSIFIYGKANGKMKMLNQMLCFQRAFPEVEIKLSS